MNVAPSDPSERTHEAARSCSGSVALPVLDTLGAAIGGANIAISVTAEDKVRIYGIPVDKEVGLGLGITQLTVYGLAATYGYIQAARCRSLRRGGHPDEDLSEERVQPLNGGKSGPLLREAKEPDVVPGFGDDLPSWSAFRRMPIEADPNLTTRNGLSRGSP